MLPLIPALFSQFLQFYRVKHVNLGSLRDEDGGKNNSKYTTLRPQHNAQTQEAISNPQNKHGDQRVEFTITVTKKNMQEAAMQV